MTKTNSECKCELIAEIDVGKYDYAFSYIKLCILNTI